MPDLTELQRVASSFLRCFEVGGYNTEEINQITDFGLLAQKWKSVPANSEMRRLIEERMVIICANKLFRINDPDKLNEILTEAPPDSMVESMIVSRISELVRQINDFRDITEWYEIIFWDHSYLLNDILESRAKELLPAHLSERRFSNLDIVILDQCFISEKEINDEIIKRIESADVNDLPEEIVSLLKLSAIYDVPDHLQQPLKQLAERIVA